MSAGPEKRPRVGFLGMGWIGRNRMKDIVRSEQVQVVGLCDPAADAAREARALAPGAKCVGSLDALLDLGLDGLVIATPSAAHAEQSLRALERGVAVFCQKPLGRTAGEVRRVVDAARAADRLLGVDLSYRFTTGMRHLHEHIQSGALGHVYAVNLVFHNAYGPDKLWFYDPKQAGGGCVMDLGIHLVDLALWTLGFPTVETVSARRFARGQRLTSREEGVEDFAAAQLVLGTGACVQLACSWKLPAGCDAVIEAAFYGTKGGAALRNVDGSFFDFTADVFQGTRRERLSAPPDAWGGRAAVAWATRLAKGERFDVETERLVDVATALDLLYA
ncbi:Gfo/Idh/MocA family protein [Corallococcus aberystwythensis]|uniref:Gfo/Idh/MocA family oxidoreductase n=1 Tax=Corallococcus aberystwythensis TaxID=2316722 RepID=A0A3A8PWM9_9BACT|nr:Gfo/Idh/MocA family oxidoreductase [Corallococcus aberystwythensis]RKH55884.1 gfo/Idh/MocA family oxidoreductase [Corallococcus aberystwythensis]